MKRLLLPVLLVLALHTVPAENIRFYVGTYTGRSGSKGIYMSELDTETGKLGPIQLAAEAESPSFLAMNPDGKYLYAGSDGKGGSAIAFHVEKDGKLTLLNQVPTGKGGGVTHVWLVPSSQALLAASYGGGSISAFKIKSDGSLTEPTGSAQFEGSGPDKSRQEKPHAHSIYTDEAGKFVYSCDLGTDKVWIFTLDEKGALTPATPPFATVPPGGGPRHLAFTPDGKYVYVANEMGHTVTAFTHDAKTGALEKFQDISTLPEGLKHDGTITVAEIFTHPTGKWLYVTNRGYDSIAVYNIAKDGRLTWIQDVPSPVNFPRGFAIDPSGKWLVVAGQNDNKISPLKIDGETGKLTPTTEFIEAGSPVNIQFAPAKK